MEHPLISKKIQTGFEAGILKREKDDEIRTGASGASGGSHGSIPGGLRSA